MVDIFLALKGKLERDLKATGFSPSKDPPKETEPVIDKVLSKCTSTELRDLYDEFLMFYNYITDQITRCLCFLEVTKARQSQHHAEAMQEAHISKKLTNADLRKAYVETHGSYLAAKRDYLYFKQLLSAQEERRRKISKSMERISREIWLQTQEPDTPKPKGLSHRYRKVE